MGSVDLHTHSTFSDGTCSPSELVNKAVFLKKNVISFCVVLGLMYVFSVILLGIGSVIIWKIGVTAKSISMAVILVYVLSCFGGGFLLGKKTGSRKLLWGCLIGAVYFGILLLIGLVAGNTTLAGNSWIFSGGIVCAVAGMVGGMLAPVSEG